MHSTGSFFVYHFWSNWNLKTLSFEERGNPDYPERNLSEQGREPTTNSTYIWRRHIVRRRYSYYCATITSFQSPL